MFKIKMAILVVLIGFSGTVCARNRCDFDKPCIDARGVEVNIVPLRPHGSHNFSESACVNGMCVCEEKIDVLHIGTDPALNAQWLEQAKNHQCKAASSQVNYLPLQVYARPGLLSTVIYNLDYCQDCGGSCHGHYETVTYVGNTAVSMENIVSSSNYNELKQVLLEELKETDGAKESGNDWSNIVISSDEYLDKNFWRNGFFIEGGKVKYNFGEFLFGCAGGSFNPVEIPEKFIHPEFSALLKTQNQ